MPRHTIRQAKRDDLAFPVRVKVRVPREGLGPLLDRMQVWLRENVGAFDHACHSQPGLACDTAACYCRAAEVALQFWRAFSAVQLADILASLACRSERCSKKAKKSDDSGGRNIFFLIDCSGR